jgi:ABC-type amino acid transport substrate-binding protein
MKRFLLAFLLIGAFINNAEAQYMLNKENYLVNDVSMIGLPDFPPFSYYEKGKDFYNLSGAFVQPTLDVMKKYGFKLEADERRDISFQQLILDIRSGANQLFIGAYSNTKMFSGIELIFPASVSNPIHVITLPQTQEKIHKAADLKNMRGIISRTEYFSDFVLRKAKSLNITYVDTPYEAYEKIFTGEADYILGSLYYNRIMASRYGIERYLSHSKSPLFKIPVFLGLYKQMPMFSQYLKAFQTEFAKPEYATAVKKEILRIVEGEIEKNIGVVPPSFAKIEELTEVPAEQEEQDVTTQKQGGKIIEKEVKQKTIDEVLEGI